MPPRRDMHRDVHEDREAPPLRPPSTYNVTRMLEGIAQLLERSQGAPRAQPDIYEWFRRLDPKDFLGTTNTFVAEGWIRSLEVHFWYLNMGDAARVKCATYFFKDDALLLWEGTERVSIWIPLLGHISWRFSLLNNSLLHVRGRFKRYFMSLRHGDLSVAEYIQKFDRGCHFVPLIPMTQLKIWGISLMASSLHTSGCNDDGAGILCFSYY